LCREKRVGAFSRKNSSFLRISAPSSSLHGSVVTSNRDFSEWLAVFSNPLMGSAAMDRLVHRGNEIVIEGKSYRVDSFLKRSCTLTENAEAG